MKYGGEKTAWGRGNRHWPEVNMKRMGVGVSKHLWDQPKHVQTRTSLEFSTCIPP